MTKKSPTKATKKLGLAKDIQTLMAFPAQDFPAQDNVAPPEPTKPPEPTFEDLVFNVLKNNPERLAQLIEENFSLSLRTRCDACGDQLVVELRANHRDYRDAPVMSDYVHISNHG